MRGKIYLLSILMASLFLSACASNKNYSGPTRPKSEVAIIFIGEGGLHAAPVRVLPYVINGKPAHWAPGWNDLSMQILPGPVELEVRYQTGYAYGKTARLITFNAVAGGRYVLDYWDNFQDKTWGAYIMEKSTKKTIAEGVVYDHHDVQKDR